jgi:hypothetical protein
MAQLIVRRHDADMKTSRLPAIALGALCLAFVVYLASSAPLLPERVAIHFGAGGHPNRWMTRTSHLVFLGALGLGLPLLFAFIFVRHFAKTAEPTAGGNAG